MKHVTILATSMNTGSKSQLLARSFEELLFSKGLSTERIDLRQLELPVAGSPGSWENPNTMALKESIERATHVVFAVPIYCYDVNSAAKNVIELAGRSFTAKVVSFICTAGGGRSYMSAMGLANHLMLDFRSVIVPRFLFVESDEWTNDGEVNPEIMTRMKRLMNEMRMIHLGPVSD